MVIELDGRAMTDRPAAHSHLVQQLELPSWYGRNLDALYDVLTEMSGPIEIVFLNFREFTHQLPGFGEAVEHLCADVQAENPELLIVLE